MSMFEYNYLKTHLIDKKMAAESKTLLNGLYYPTETIHFKGHTVHKGQYVYLSLGEIHNSDGPALITPRDVYYFEKSKIHRDKGPAVIGYQHPLTWNGHHLTRKSDEIAHQYYSKNGLFHRLDGPAMAFPHNTNNNTYYINGTRILKKDYDTHPEVLKHQVLTIIHSS